MAAKTGIVDVGGGMRGIFAAGVLDYCLDNNIEFDLGIGVSAGSANLASFVSKQKNRSYLFYAEYSFRKQYMSLDNFLKKGSYIDLDYVFGELCNTGSEYPLDYQAMLSNPMEYIVVATNALTGKPRYFTKADTRQNHYDIIKASSAIPFACKPYYIDGTPYFDGALGDPVPIEKAFDLGCEKVVLLLSKPVDEIRTTKKDTLPARMIRKKYPEASEQLLLRAKKYNNSVAWARHYARQGKLLIVSPDDTCGVDTLKRDKESMDLLYEKGYSCGQLIKGFLEK